MSATTASSMTSEQATTVADVLTTSKVLPPKAPYNELYWIFSEVVICFVTIFAIYLLVCLARYATITHCKPGRELSGKKGKILYRMCLISVVMAVCRFVVDQAVAVTGWQRDENCVISVAVSTVFYSLSLYPVYIFLWLRQSIFYANPVLAHVLNPVVTFFSWATLFVMLSGGAVLTTIYVIPELTGWDYRASQDGCRDVATEQGFDLLPTLVVAFTVSFQISLLALFVYPLLTKKTQRYRSADETATSGNEAREQEMDAYNSAPGDAENQEEGEERKKKSSSSFHFAKSKKKLFKAPCVFYKSKDVGISTIRVKDDAKKKKKSRFSTSSGPDGIRRTSSSSNADSKKNKRIKTQQGRRVIQFIRKAFLLTLICVLSDVIFTVVQMMIIVPELVYLAIFDINLLLNIICIIMSFRDWPNMIMPFCAKKLAERKNAQSASVSGNGARNNTTRLILTMAQSRRDAQQRAVNQHSSSTPAEDESSVVAKEPLAETRT